MLWASGLRICHLEDLVPASERLRRSVRRRRTAALATALAVLGGALTLGLPSASASVIVLGGGATAHTTAASPKVVWAMTVTGRWVRLTKPKFIPTPVHPEKITHPLLDFMGSTVASHEHWSGSGVGVRPNSVVPQLPGIDVSAYQGNINWGYVAPYIDFSYAKATEGTYYTNPYFYNQYVGPYDYGIIRGAYHFANPANSQGNTQADYFSHHGGGWSSDGLTLPGALDIEYNPYGPECYRLTHSQMVNWIWNFVHEYAYRWHAYPVIYSTTNWWTTCTGNYGGFGSYDPLWIANYSASHGGPLPNGWSFYTFWQYADHGSLPGDQDVFNGAYTRLQTLARNG
jgi:GH25 family lysozyme M1 (1,4-beta-N-acetylmuramidase)